MKLLVDVTGVNYFISRREKKKKRKAEYKWMELHELVDFM